MPRLRLFDFRMSEGPGDVGICREDVASVANCANAVQRRLMLCKEAGESGWWGGWAEVLLMASRTLPYVTLPREIARIESINVCNTPRRVQNQFFEYLQFGNGRLPKTCNRNGCIPAAYSRNNAVTFIEPPTQPFFIQAFALDSADVQANARVLVQGADEAGNVVYSQAGVNQVQGEYITLQTPFVTTIHQFSTLTGLQKDVTVGAVQIMSVDVNTGASTLLLTMEPGEQTASYRRYYFNSLPISCCPPPSGTVPQLVPITAIAKLDLIPALVDQDWLLIQNLEAMVEEAQSWRLSKIDGISAKQESRERHKAAVELLNGEIIHFLGKNDPAYNFAPFGSARFSRVTRGFI